MVRRLLLACLLLLLVPGIARAAPLANTAHLDFLGDTVVPPSQPDHSTFGSGPIGVLWTYADRNADGSYRRVGGGAYDAATNTYGQGAFNADDIARAAVVYVRHWQATGSAASRERAYALLRGLAYLQSPNGNVVLWMQPDGTLNPSAEPVELPDPSDSGPSYWLARTVWAFGEGYRAFRRDDAKFAQFLRNRLDLALRALEREVLTTYPQSQVVDGRNVPSWLIVDGADATAEAMLGLAAYDSPDARRALSRFAEGVAALATKPGSEWPYGAVLPWALSRSIWHAWASQMPAALAAAATAGTRADAAGGSDDALAGAGGGASPGEAGAGGDGPPAGAVDRDRLLSAALADAASFTPHLLVAGGPQNGWNPSPSDGTQIAYGADSRLQSLLAVAEAARRPGLRRLAGIAGSWYFGNNPAGAALYDPSTGVTFDGVSADGVINRNSGAESTIHGLLSMLALDEHPQVARWARVASVASRETRRVVEAEGASLRGGAQVVTPPSAWTGESAWSGAAYVSLPPGGAVDFGTVDGIVEAVALRTEGPGGGATAWSTGARIDHSNAGPSGSSPAPGRIEILRAGVAHGDLRATQAGDGTTALDAIQVQPAIEHVTLRGGGHVQTLLRSFAAHTRRVLVTGRATSYDPRGRAFAHARGGAVRIPAGGFAIADR